MPTVLRIEADPGYLSNKRMALEIGVGLAHLSGRTLSLPVDAPIGWGPRPALEGEDAGPPSTLRDLYELPVPVLGDDDYAAAAPRTPFRPDWTSLANVAVVDPPGTGDGRDVEAFANGRPVTTLDAPWTEQDVVEVPGRALAHYSHVFCLEPVRRRRLFGLLEAIRPREQYRDLGRAVSDDLGEYNAAHIRRTDHLKGVPDYRRVSPRVISDNLAAVFPTEQRLVVCTEADSASDVFVPLRSRFDDVVFLNDRILGPGPWRRRFAGLPRHDDSALALISQEVASRALGFAGTFASTFTGIIHRQRCLRDPSAPFLFTANFLRGDFRFEDCEYQPVRPGPYSWNRLAYPVSPNVFSWMREWPEVADFADRAAPIR